MNTQSRIATLVVIVALLGACGEGSEEDGGSEGHSGYETADELIDASGIEVEDCAQVNVDRAALAGLKSSSTCSTTDGKGYVTAFVGVPEKGMDFLAREWEGESVTGDDWFLSVLHPDADEMLQDFGD